MLNQAKINCEFANWHPHFAHLVPKVKILEAPEDFREYLLSDGIALREENAQKSDDDDWETNIDGVAQDGSDEEADILLQPPKEFHDIIENAITELNGEVAPKLNWSAPVDSKWITTSNTMRCTSANEIYMLLKSSDYVNHDLSLEPPKLTLVLREWFDLHPSTEFRCFVKEHVLVAITQRDMNFYDFLNAAQAHIVSACTELAGLICDKFPDRNFVFDVHIPKHGSKAFLIDINPWDSQTDTLLYTWDELNSIDHKNVSEPEIRLIEKVDRSRTFSSKPHSTSHVPYDFVDMDRNSLADMLKQMKEQRNAEVSKKEI